MNIGFLASHNGSNMQAIIDAANSGELEAKPVAVISNNSSSGAMERAKKEGIAGFHLSSKTHPDPADLDKAILDALGNSGVDLVILAGYMKKLGPLVLTAYKNRILNVHPALLPKHGGVGMYGMNVHNAVIAAGDAESGATIHIVDGEYDTGPVLSQAKVPVEKDDTPETLAARVLKKEHRLFSETIQKIVIGEITLPDQ